MCKYIITLLPCPDPDLPLSRSLSRAHTQTNTHTHIHTHAHTHTDTVTLIMTLVHLTRDIMVSFISLSLPFSLSLSLSLSPFCLPLSSHPSYRCFFVPPPSPGDGCHTLAESRQERCDDGSTPAVIMALMFEMPIVWPICWAAYLLFASLAGIACQTSRNCRGLGSNLAVHVCARVCR